MTNRASRLVIAATLGWGALAATVILGTHGDVVTELRAGGPVLEAPAPALVMPDLEVEVKGDC